jgi:hypothetical protein
MIVLITLALALIPVAAILYPFFGRRLVATVLEDETSPRAEMERRWDAALAGLRTAELERAVGSLAEDDYRWIRERYMTDAALVMKSMELEEQEEREMLAAVETEVRQVHERILGEKGASETGRLPAD